MFFLSDHTLKVQLFRNPFLKSYLTVVENSLKRSAVNQGTRVAVKGFFVQKDMQNAYLCITFCHMISYMQHFLNNDKQTIMWTKQNLPTSGRWKSNQHSLKYGNKKSRKKKKELFC